MQFADETNSTVVISIKGTSAGVLGSGGPTSRNDKFNVSVASSGRMRPNPSGQFSGMVDASSYIRTLTQTRTWSSSGKPSHHLSSQ